MIPVHQLKQCPARRQVYFGLPQHGTHSGLDGWITHCNRLRKKPVDRYQDILSRMEQIRCNIEIGPKFKDWRDVTTIRRRARANELRRKFNSWRKLFLPSRYKILCAIFSNLAPLMRYRFLIWKERTRWQRAIEFHDRKTKRRVVDALRAYARFSRRSRLAQKFLRWKQMLIFVRRLKKITIFDSLSIKRAFAKWRLLPATPMQVAGPPPRDCSLLMRVLQRWALNKTRRFFQRWRLRPDAPDDDYNCVCIAKICRGQHCDCRKDVHFRRRLQYCFQEVEAARDDKIRIRKDLRVAKQILKESSADARLKLKKDRFAKRVSSVSNVASSALKSSQQQTSKSATKPESARKRQVISPYISRGVGEAARRVATGNLAPAQVVPVRSSMSTPPRTQRSPLASPARTSSSRKGLLHSLDGVMASHNHLRHSINAVDEDISHWDLKHLQVQAPDLTQYESLEF